MRPTVLIVGDRRNLGDRRNVFYLEAETSKPNNSDGFSLDDVFSQLEQNSTVEELEDANRFVANALYPEHRKNPTLAVLRLRAGLTQKGLADKMGKRQPYIARIEKGSENITFHTLSALASALSVTIEDAAAAMSETLRLGSLNA